MNFVSEALLVGGVLAAIGGFVVGIRAAYRADPMVGVVISFFPILIPPYAIWKPKHGGGPLVVSFIGMAILAFAVDYAKIADTHREPLYALDSAMGGVFGVDAPVVKSAFDERPELALEPGRIVGVVDGREFTCSQAVIKENKLILVSELVDEKVIPDLEIRVDLPVESATDFDDAFHVHFRPEEIGATHVSIAKYNVKDGSREMLHTETGFDMEIQINRTANGSYFGFIDFFYPGKKKTHIAGEFVADHVRTGKTAHIQKNDVKGSVESVITEKIEQTFSRYVSSVTEIAGTRWYVQDGIAIAKSHVTIELKNSQWVKTLVSLRNSGDRWEVLPDSLIKLQERIVPKESTEVRVSTKRIGQRVTNFEDAVSKRVIVESVQGLRRAGILKGVDAYHITLAIEVGDGQAEYHVGLGTIEAIYYPKK